MHISQLGGYIFRLIKIKSGPPDVEHRPRRTVERHPRTRRRSTRDSAAALQGPQGHLLQRPDDPGHGSHRLPQPRPQRLLQPVTENKQMPASSTQSAVAGINEEGYRLLLGLLHGREFHDEVVQFFGQTLLVVVTLLGGHVDDLQGITTHKHAVHRLNFGGQRHFL